MRKRSVTAALKPKRKTPPSPADTEEGLPRYAAADTSLQVQRTRARLQEAARRVFGRKGMAVSINDVVEAAGISRPSFYNYYTTIEQLLESVTEDMVAELNAQIDASVRGVDDPAARIAIGIRQYCKWAHDDPDWANFLLHFGLLNPHIIEVMRRSLLRDIELGVQSGRFPIGNDQVNGVFALIVGGALAAIMMIRRGVDGHLAIGQKTAQAALRALGIKPKDAAAVSRLPLPELQP
jgi:AcrR family transcriptional regulator